eukprot:6457967-Prymnesium_polylepis.1
MTWRTPKNLSPRRAAATGPARGPTHRAPPRRSHWTTAPARPGARVGRTSAPARPAPRRRHADTEEEEEEEHRYARTALFFFFFRHRNQRRDTGADGCRRATWAAQGAYLLVLSTTCISL